MPQQTVEQPPAGMNAPLPPKKFLNRREFDEQILGMQPGQIFNLRKAEEEYWRYRIGRAAQLRQEEAKAKKKEPEFAFKRARSLQSKADTKLVKVGEIEDPDKALKEISRIQKEFFASLMLDKSVKELFGVRKDSEKANKEILPFNDDGSINEMAEKWLGVVVPPYGMFKIKAMRAMIPHVARKKGTDYNGIVGAGDEAGPQGELPPPPQEFQKFHRPGATTPAPSDLSGRAFHLRTGRFRRNLPQPKLNGTAKPALPSPATAVPGLPAPSTTTAERQPLAVGTIVRNPKTGARLRLGEDGKWHPVK